MVVGGAVAIVGTFLPWLRSGSADRSSYVMFDLLDRLGFSPAGPVAAAVRVWPIVPLLLVSAVVVQFSMSVRPRWVWARRLLPVVAGLYALAVAVAIRFAPGVGLIRLRYGSIVTATGAAAVLVSALWPVSRTTGRGRRGRP